MNLSNQEKTLECDEIFKQKEASLKFSSVNLYEINNLLNETNQAVWSV